MNLHYTFTPAIVRDLMDIESARQAVRLTVLPPQVVERLRQQARVRSTHYSTRIEGNRLHAIIFTGPRARPTLYRDGQNVIRDAVSGQIIYMPPEAADVPGLMRDLVDWIAQAERDELPAPVIAGLAHYQFVTIHLFYDGNGRTVRALATLILFRHGYDLGRFYSLEEEYVRPVGLLRRVADAPAPQLLRGPRRG